MTAMTCGECQRPVSPDEEYRELGGEAYHFPECHEKRKQRWLKNQGAVAGYDAVEDAALQKRIVSVLQAARRFAGGGSLVATALHQDITGLLLELQRRGWTI